MNKSAFIFCLVIIALSCSKDVPYTLVYNTNYFGVIQGRYAIYNVQEMSHDVNLIPKHDTNTYQLKTVIGNEYIDNKNRKGYEFLRYVFDTIYQQWTLKDTWVIYHDNSNGELVEENQRIIKLTFPIRTEKEWNSNTFNNEPEKKYFYSNIHKPRTIGSLNFDSTLQVKQQYFKSLIDFQNQYEYYATNVGLISKVYKNLIIDNFDTLSIQKGNEIHYQIIEYGFE